MPKTDPKTRQRNALIAQLRLQGKTQREIGKEVGMSHVGVGKVLKREDIQKIIERGCARMVEKIPKALDVVENAMSQKKDMSLAYKAAVDCLKTTGVMPSPVTTQYITNVITQNNNAIIHPEVAKILAGMAKTVEDDTEEGEIIDI